MEFLEPWYAVEDSAAIERQLRSELPGNHVLANVPLAAVAHRQDQDDFLFLLNDGSERVAVVHLTYSLNTNPLWPHTQFYASLPAWATERMAQDHAEFGA